MHNKVLNTIVKVLIIAAIIAGSALAGLIAAVSLPSILMEKNGVSYFVIVLILFILFYAGALTIGIILFRMMLSVDHDPFIMRNVLRMRIMGFVALGMGVCTLALLFIPLNTLIFQAAGLAVGMCGLLSLVMSSVFERAVAYKLENDMTI